MNETKRKEKKLLNCSADWRELNCNENKQLNIYRRINESGIIYGETKIAIYTEQRARARASIASLWPTTKKLLIKKNFNKSRRDRVPP